MIGLHDLLAAPYLARALVLVLVLGLACAPVGTLVNLRRAEFSAEALVHAVFPGIVIGAVAWGRGGIIPTAMAVGAVAALVLARTGRRARRDSAEAGTAVVLTAFFSVGLVILLAKGDMSGQLEALMFGRLLEVTGSRLAEALLACAAGLAAAALTWKEQVAVAFDPVGARASRPRPEVLDVVLELALAAVVVAGAAAVGTLLVIAYVVIPASTGRVVATSVRGQVGVAAVIGVLSGVLGLLLAASPAPRPVSPQAAIVLVMVLCLLVVAVPARCRSLRGGIA